jgi:nicotinic acid mononucleotide adenylyltransferase
VSVFNEDNGKPITYTCDMVKLLPWWETSSLISYSIVLGLDEVKFLGSWKDPETIFNRAGLVIFGRGEHAASACRVASEISAGPVVKSAISDAWVFDLAPEFGMSSTDVRSAFASSQPLDARKMVNFRVWKYATMKGIY